MCGRATKSGGGGVQMTHITSYKAALSSRNPRSRLYSKESMAMKNHRLRKVIKHIGCCVMFVLERHQFSPWSWVLSQIFLKRKHILTGWWYWVTSSAWETFQLVTVLFVSTAVSIHEKKCSQAFLLFISKACVGWLSTYRGHVLMYLTG